MYSSLSRETLQELVEEVYNPRCVPPWSPHEIEHKLEDADRLFEEPRGLASPDFLLGLAGRTSATSPKAPDEMHEYTFEVGMRSAEEVKKAAFGETVADLIDHVEWAGVFQYDLFRDRAMAVDPPMKMDAETKGMSDNDIQLVRVWFEYHGKKLQTPDIRAAVELVARKNAYDVRINWLRSLRWDGVDRLSTVLHTYFNTADGPYESLIGVKWFIGMIARAMTPGCQMDYTLVLEGKGGLKKTNAFKALMPVASWYAETTASLGKKDFYENLVGVWLMAFDELDSFSRSDLTGVKKILTSTTDCFRNSYGRYSDDHPRTCCFCGTTNEKQYVKDDAMGRRIWSALVLARIDAEKIARDREQIWAEAFVRWQRGEPWYPDTDAAEALCEEQQEERQETDPWDAYFLAWLKNPDKVSWVPVPPPPPGTPTRLIPIYDASNGVTCSDALIGTGLRKREDQTPGDLQRAGRVFHRLGSKRKRRRITNKLGTTEKSSLEWRHFFED